MSNTDQILSLIQKGQEQHYHDDDVRFGVIMKTQEKHEELMKINGEHMSHIRKDMNDMKNLLIQNSEKIEANRIITEPIVLAYNKDLIIKANDTGRGEKVIRWSLLAGSVLGLVTFLKWVYDIINFKQIQ